MANRGSRRQTSQIVRWTLVKRGSGHLQLSRFAGVLSETGFQQSLAEQICTSPERNGARAQNILRILVLARGKRGSSNGCLGSFVLWRGQNGVRALGSLRDLHFGEGITGFELKIVINFLVCLGENGVRVPFWLRNSSHVLGETEFDEHFQGASWRRQNHMGCPGSKMVQEIVEAATAHKGSVRLCFW